ncbi:MAG: prenyltransferase/squalene oxidase repeat-containing protein, partial [Solirubrobacteraceae bacterium]
RDAFAAIPDVKPITAIVLVSGVTFGAGPGFAVGAIAALASNVLLGEGPWTPWQMLGWGVVGLLGAGLGRLAGRRPHALVLAVSAALAAEVFNLIADLSTWTSTGEQTLAAFGVVLGAALSFDLTHVVASFAFALAFGPALARMLARVRARLEVSWQPAASTTAALLIVALLAVPALVPGRAQASGATRSEATTARLALTRELDYLARAQNADGGFGGAPGQPSSGLYTSWAAIGLAAAGRDPATLRRGGRTVLQALRAEAGSLRGTGDLERTILALRACGVPGGVLRARGGPVAKLLAARAADGSFGGLSNLTAFAIFALRAAGEPRAAPVISSAVAWLARQQNTDGGFGFGPRGGGSDVDDTAAALQALAAAGRGGGPTVQRALAFLLGAQNLDGGYPQEQGGESNAQSTAWASQALVAAGRAPGTVTRGGSRSPLGYLESLLTGSGSVRYSRTGAQTPVWVTAQALTALAARPFPIAPVERGRRAARAARAPRPAVAPGSLGARILGFAAHAIGLLLSAA